MSLAIHCFALIWIFPDHNTSGYSFMQDDLDYHVDVTDSRLRVIVCFNSYIFQQNTLVIPSYSMK